jgi:hypothetical protein
MAKCKCGRHIGYASRLLKGEERYVDPDYKERLRKFQQVVNPKPGYKESVEEEVSTHA